MIDDDALVDPAPGAGPLSTHTTCRPLRASSSVTAAPMTPAPITTASAVSAVAPMPAACHDGSARTDARERCVSGTPGPAPDRPTRGFSMSTTGGTDGQADVDRPAVPTGRYVWLAGRGRTFVRELAGPAGAPTVVLLHGWTATADLNWWASYTPLSEHFNVVALDHRGHGRGIRSTAPFRLEQC